MMASWRRLGFVAATAIVMQAAGAHAEPVLDMTYSPSESVMSVNTQTVGWSFTANADLTVSALGIFDPTGNGLVVAHQVGIWDSSTGDSLVVSATVPAGTGGVLDGFFRYVSVSPTHLTAGDSYLVGGFYTAGGPDNFVIQADSVTTIPQITYNYGSYQFGFTAPTNPYDSSGIFGANFQVSLVPEPSPLITLALSAPLASLYFRRRRSVS